MKVNKRKVLSIFFASIISTTAVGTTAYSIVTYSKNHISVNPVEVSKEPVLNLDQTLNINSEKNQKEFRRYFLDYYDYLFIDSRISFFRNELNLNKKIESALDITFKDIINSNEFKQLELSNDWFQVVNRFKSICNSSYEYFPKILSKVLKWDEGFTYLLIDNKIDNVTFSSIFNDFKNIISESFYKKAFDDAFTSTTDNEKMKWIFEKTNTKDIDLKTMSNNSIQNEIEDVYNNIDIYQKYLMKKHKISYNQKTDSGSYIELFSTWFKKTINLYINDASIWTKSLGSITNEEVIKLLKKLLIIYLIV